MTSAMDVAEERGTILLSLARRSLELAVLRDGQRSWRDEASATFLDERGSSFVTLTRGGKLRGCIGSIDRARALGEDVWQNARDAAFRDFRFPPVERSELSSVHVEVSVLSLPEPTHARSLEEAAAALRPGIDGALLVGSGHRGLFLPQVWASLPAPERFLAGLLKKAGLSSWPKNAQLSRFTVEIWSES